MAKFKELIQNTMAERQRDYLERIYVSFDNIEFVKDTEEQPPRLIANAGIKHDTQISPVRTTINVRLGFQKRDDSVEFSTYVGQLPNNALGNAIVEGLNYRWSGKFVTFDAEQTEKIHVTYNSSKPATWLDNTGIQQELDNHVNMQEVIKPIFNDTSIYQNPDPKLTYPEIRNVARDIVDTTLSRWQNQPFSNLTPALPSPRDFMEKKLKTR